MKFISLFLLFIFPFNTSIAGSSPLKNPFEVKQTKWLFRSKMGGSNQRMNIAGDMIGNPIRHLSLLINKNCWSKKSHSAMFSELSGEFRGYGQEQSVRFEVPIERNFGDVHQEILVEDCIVGVGPSGNLKFQSVDPLVPNQKHITAMGGLNSFSSYFEGGQQFKSNVTIAIIDTGIEMQHPEFEDRLWINEAEKNGTPGVDDDKNGYVDDINGYDFVEKTGRTEHKNSNDHGTHVAGLAAATIGNGIGGVGIMGGKNLKLMILNVLGSHWDDVNLTDVEQAIRYAADKGADVINLSVSGVGEYPTLAAAIVYALNKGSVIVVAAGNGKSNIDQDFQSPVSYAKDYPGMISVAAFDSQGFGLCDFTNVGLKSVKISAPGCDLSSLNSGLFSTTRKGTYGYRKGTSMAAPLVSGTAALILSYMKDHGAKPSPQQLESLLLSLTTEDSRQKSPVFSGRRLDLTGLSKTLALFAN